MNLLFISTKGDWGGSEPLWCEAAERALKEGHEVTVIIPEIAEFHERHKGLMQLGARFVLRPKRQQPTFWRRLQWKLKGTTRPETDWWKSNVPGNPDAVCASQGGAYCVVDMPGLAPWLIESQLPYILVGHSHRPYALPTGARRELAREVFDKAIMVCFDAAAHVAAASRFLAIGLAHGRAVQNPVNLRNTDAVRREGEGERENPESGKAEPEPKAETGLSQRLKSDKKADRKWEIGDGGREVGDSRLEIGDGARKVVTMACVARFEIRDKGQDLLIEALADPVWRERDFRLDFYGSGPDREVLEELIAFHGLGKKVRVVGFESDVRKIWKEHGLLVLPSLSEGTPISLIEAQLCARASLVTRVDGNPEWVEDSKTGFIAEAATVHHLREALERAWESRARWKEMGEAARAACLAKRDPDPAGGLLALLLSAAAVGR